MAITQTHTSTGQMSGHASAEHILDGSYGYSLSNAVLKLVDAEHNLHLDGQTLTSDGTFVINTSASKKLIFGVDDTERLQITTDGALDILSGKLLINGNSGSSNQVLTTDGTGNISWSTPITQENDFKTLSVPLREARENFEKEYLITQLKKNGGNISKTAKFVGMERSALHRKLKLLGVKDLN